MIPLEKLIPIEAKARKYDYLTEIKNGGAFITFTKYKYGSTFTLICDKSNLFLWTPANSKATFEEFNEFLDEQNRLLELAKMLQEVIIDEKPDE